jgi:oligosaccharide repeat unit polymerase
MTLIILILNLIFYFSIFVFGFKKNKVSPSSFIALIWFLGSFCAIIYYYSALFKHDSGSNILPSIGLMPILFILLCFLIYYKSIEKFDNRIQHVTNMNVLYQILIVLIAFSAYLPFIENVMYLFKDFNLAKFALVYDNREEDFDVREHMTWLGARLNSLGTLTKYLHPIFLLSYLRQKNKKRIITIGLILALLNPMILGLSMGARYQIMYTIFNFLIAALILKDTLDNTLKIKLKKVGLVVIGLFSIVLIVFTLVRFSVENDHFIEVFPVQDYVASYAGQGFINFSIDVWTNLKNHTDGANSFNLILGSDRLGLDSITNIRMYVYYTIFGDFFIDYGLYSVLIIIFLSCFFYFTKTINGKMSIGTVILLHLWAIGLLDGLFYFQFIGNNYGLIVSGFIGLILLKKA